MAQSPVALHASSPAELRERIEAERRGTPFLVYRDGGGNQHIVDLVETKSPLAIGRRPMNDIPLPWDLGVSRVHAQLERIGGTWTLVDDGLSRNGSYVNGNRHSGRYRLVDGDAMRFGDTVVVYRAPRPESSVTAARAEIPTAEMLSPAQRRVLLALCRPYKDTGGYAAPASNQAIADELVLSVESVKTHLRALFQTFGVAHLPQNQKRARLVERAFNSGIVTERDL